MNSLALLPVALLLATPAHAALTRLDTGHMDIEINYGADQGWQLSYHNDVLGDHALDSALLFGADADPSDGGIRLYSEGLSSLSLLSFLGSRNDTMWVFEQSSPQQGQLWPGLSAEGTTFGSNSPIARWTPDDDRVSSENNWIVLELLGMTYEGEEEDAHFSLWSNSGGFKVWMSTAEGGIDSEDKYYLAAGGHSHVNWGFNAPGLYTLEMRASAPSAADPNVMMVSDPFELTFEIGAVPEPGTLALAGLGLPLLGRRKRA